ncbi:thioesterase [Butyrivibrio sp. X503]|nr:thioesterase [Butyrivibrio sp. X503]
MVSGSRAPHIPELRPICRLSDSDFLDEISHFEGTPSEILNNKEIVEFFMPLLRADFTMDEQYVLQDKVKLSCPIFAFYGANDSEADGKDMDKWKIYTDSFGIKQFKGKHFFVKTSMESVIEEVNRQLE